MKRSLFLLLLLPFFTGAAAQQTLRLMTYNVRHATGLDNLTDYARTAGVIRAARPDVAALQEVDSCTQRSGGKYTAGELAERLGMHATFAAAIPYDGGSYGVALLSKRAPLGVKRLPLPGREEARTLLIAEFDDYVVAATHLSLTEADRLASLKIIEREAAAAHKPFILAGDLNAQPDDAFMKQLKSRFKLLSNAKQPTYPADKPTETLDYIALYRPSAPVHRVERAFVPQAAVESDHRPVVADLRRAVKPEALITVAPYLQNPTGDGITVMLETRTQSSVWVEYGTDSLHLSSTRHLLDGQAVCDGPIHKIRLSALQPGRTYYYRVCARELLHYGAYSKTLGDTVKTAFAAFRLPASDEADFTAVVFNDLHQNAATFRALCAQLEGIDYDFAVFNGDCIDDPASKEQATRMVAELTGGVKAASRPAFFIRGNHEIRNVYSVGLRNHFDYPDNRTYGAFSWGKTRFVILDCGEDKPDSHPVYYGLNDFSALREAQAAFMKREFASKAFRKAERRVLIHHIPLFYNNWPNLCDSLWTPILTDPKLTRRAPFDISINAHTHAFAYHPAGGKAGNPYPVYIGGGPSADKATVAILSRKGKRLTLKVVNPKGETLLEETY